MKWLVIIAVIPLVVIGCAYSTSSKTTREGLKTIAVPFFVNQTSEPNLEITVTEKIIQNLVEDNTLDVVDENRADAVLDGTITDFTNAPFSFNQDLNAEEYHVIISVRLSLFNRRLNQAIWDNKIVRGDGSYFLDVSEQGFTYDEALKEAIKEITDQILNLTVQDW